MQDPLFFFFPVLERQFLNFLPKRKLIHDDCDRFLKLLDDMIQEKRKIVNGDEGIVTGNKSDILEKDILTLLLENEKNDNDSNTFMTNEELKVGTKSPLIYFAVLLIPYYKSNLCVFFSAGHDSTTGALSFALYHMAVNPVSSEKKNTIHLDANYTLGYTTKSQGGSIKCIGRFE